MKKVYIEITNSCNLNCEFCRNTDRKKEFMSISDFERVIKQVKKYTKLVCLHIKGEPLLYPNLKQILDIIEDNDLKVNITTNGTLINNKIDDLLNSNAVRQINISLHSCIENENINIEKYMNNVFECVNKVKHKIIISYRLWNLESLTDNSENKEVIDLLAKKYNIENLRKLLIKNEWIKLDDNVFLNQDTKFIWPNLNEKILLEEGRCLALKEQFGILVDGTVVPCCIDSEGEIKLGNVFEENLEHILNSSYTKEILSCFEKRIIKEELCKRCGFLARLENKRKS